MALRIVQVGAGGWGAGWLEFIHKTAGCELAGLVSRGGANLAAAKDRWKIPDDRCFTDLAAALRLQADLFLIAVPHHLHMELARRIVAAGHNVLIEKPLADRFEPARELAEFLAGRSQKAWVSQNFRFRPELWAMRASLTDAAAGSPQWAEVRFRTGPNCRTPPAWRTDGWRGKQWSFLLQEITIHHFDMCRFLFDREAVSIHCCPFRPAWAASRGPEGLFAAITFEGGLVVNYSGTADALGLDTGWAGHWLVQTDRGSIAWEGDRLALLPASDAAPKLAEGRDFPGFDREGVLREIQAALGGRACAVPTVADNLRSFALVCAAERSVREGRTVQLSEFP